MGLIARIMNAMKKYNVFTECTQSIAADQTVIINKTTAATDSLVRPTSQVSIFLTFLSKFILHLPYIVRCLSFIKVFRIIFSSLTL